MDDTCTVAVYIVTYVHASSRHSPPVLTLSHSRQASSIASFNSGTAQVGLKRAPHHKATLADIVLSDSDAFCPVHRHLHGRLHHDVSSLPPQPRVHRFFQVCAFSQSKSF